MNLEGFILVGGASRRMGTDKSRLVLGELTSVEHVASALSTVASRVFTVGRSMTRSSQKAFDHISDVHPNWGALGGVHAALRACEAEWAAIVACDLPFVTNELFARLWSLAKRSELATLDAVVPIQVDGRPQPLCALYRREPCVKKAQEFIAAGEHTPRALLAAVSTHWVQPEDLSDLPGAEHFFFNVNTRADYERAKEILAGSLPDRPP